MGKNTTVRRYPQLHDLSPRIVLLLIVLTTATFLGAWSALLVVRGAQTNPVTASDILEDPASFYGRTVEVEDEIAEVVTATALTLGGSKADRQVLVLNVLVMPALDDTGDLDRTPVGDMVSVSGKVLPFDIVEFERIVGELNDDVYRRFEGHPALIADVVDPAPSSRD